MRQQSAQRGQATVEHVMSTSGQNLPVAVCQRNTQESAPAHATAYQLYSSSGWYCSKGLQEGDTKVMMPVLSLLSRRPSVLTSTSHIPYLPC